MTQNNLVTKSRGASQVETQNEPGGFGGGLLYERLIFNVIIEWRNGSECSVNAQPLFLARAVPNVLYQEETQ